MKETERGNGNRNQDDNIQSVSSQVFPVPVTGRSCLKTATNIAHLQIHQTMYPNDSLDSDEDEIVVLETVFIDHSPNISDPENPCEEYLNNFESQQNEKDQENVFT